MRSGPYTRSAWRFTFWQMKPWVSGLPGAASTLVIRPASTVTSSEQVSGQSRGQAVTGMPRS